MNNAEREQHLSHLPGQILLALARNDAANLEFRKAAVKIMMEKGFAEAGHPDLKVFVAQIKAEQDAQAEVESLVEQQTAEEPMSTELPKHDDYVGPLQASVTTATLFQTDVIANEEQTSQPQEEPKPEASADGSQAENQ